MAQRKLPKVGDYVKVVYYGVVTETRKGPEYLPHFELDSSDGTRHVLSEVSEIEIYDVDPAAQAVMNSFARVNRSL
jgi:hypothetical protein